MTLSAFAEQLAAEIRTQWAGAPVLLDVDARSVENIRLNVMWVTGKVLALNDPNFDIYEYSQACGCAGYSRRFIEGLADLDALRTLPSQSGDGRDSRPGSC